MKKRSIHYTASTSKDVPQHPTSVNKKTLQKKSLPKNPACTRRNFLRAATVSSVGVGTVALFNAPAVARSVQRIKMVLAWPENFPGFGTSAQRLKKRIETASDGRFKIDLFGAGKLVPALEVFDAVQNGTADIFHATPLYWQGKNSASAFFTSVPFGMLRQETNAWMKWGNGQRLWDALYEKFNLKPFQAGDTGVHMGGFYRKKIHSIEDYKGLKIRMSGLGGAVLQKLGASAVTIPAGELFQAFQSRIIDAVDWIGPWQDLVMGFHKITPYYYRPNAFEPCGHSEFVFNKSVWEKFSKSDKALLENCINSESAIASTEIDAKNIKALGTLIRKHKIDLQILTEDVYMDFARTTKHVLEEIIDTNPDAAKIYRSYRDFYREIVHWNTISTEFYMDIRKKVWQL